jgi:hypothetical protein
VFWTEIGITFGQFITLLLILIWATLDIINASNGKPTTTMSILTQMIELTEYLLKELTARNQLEVMNALFAIADFLFFFLMLIIFGIHFIKSSAFSSTLIAFVIVPLIAFPVIMHVCKKFTQPRYYRRRPQ